MKRLFVSALALTTIFSACGGGSGDGKTEGGDSVVALSGSVNIDGSSTVQPITELVVEDFKAENPGVKLAVGGGGTGSGFKKFIRKEIDVCDASRTIKDAEAHECDSLGVKYLGLEIGKDGLSIVVNPQNTWLTSITVAELKMIWEPAAEGKIKKWNQIRKEWPNEPINLHGAGHESGTFEYFTEAINGKKGACRTDYNASENDNQLVQGVAGDKYALGFFGYGYYESNKTKLKIVAVDNGAGAVTPNETTIMDGTYAPLSRPLFIYVSEESAKKPEVVAFVQYYMTKAPELVKEAHYVALPADKYKEEIAKWDAFVKGLK
ncbi:MAG: phosphate ABC transporter substrate-binding protein PstS family protein [Flavobacteriales bacterium]